MKLHNCAAVLFVKDAAASKDFYVNVLGMTVTGDFGGQNIIFAEGFAVWQVGDGNKIIEALGRENVENAVAASRFELCFETHDIDADHAALKAAGVRFLHEINTEIWGQRNIRFYDPDGHLIEVGEAMPVFLRRIYDEEKHDLTATSKRAFVPEEMLKQILAL